MKTRLPEPRRYGELAGNDIAEAAQAAARADALDEPRAIAALSRAIVTALERGDEARILDGLAQAPDAAAYRMLHAALARVLDGYGAREGAIARLFALPLVLVAAAPRAASLSGALHDVAAIEALFARTGALGATRNFGLSATLATLAALAALSPLALFRAVRSSSPQLAAAALGGVDLALEPGHERAHLRFLVGAGLAAADAPGYAETAAHIAPWGQECAAALQRQLAPAGVQLLVLPRPPRDAFSAVPAGRFAQLETALMLFASNAVRRFRSAVGDPVCIVSAHAGGEVRVTLSNPYAEGMSEGYAWPLHPADDLAAVERSVLELFADMRVHDLRVIERLLPALRANGVALYPRCDDYDALAGVTH